MAEITPVKSDLFGFLRMFGCIDVRFLTHVRVWPCSGFARKAAAPRLTEKQFPVTLGYWPCSGCSVDFVEKLCTSLRKTLWRNCGKSFLILWKSEFCTSWWKIIHGFWGGCGRFSKWFCTRFDPCKNGSFAHFPQTLLLQLLIF